MFQLASTGIKVRQVNQGGRGGISLLRIQGGVYHSIGPLNPSEGCPPEFAQMYIYDTENELENRQRVMSDKIDAGTMTRLQSMIHEVNPYVRQFQTLASHASSSEMRIVLKASHKGLQKRRYNLPTANKVAAILPGDGSEEVTSRDVVVHLHGGGVRRMSDLNEAYIPLHFVLLFPYGEPG